MNSLNWNIESILLELKYTWKISRNATDQKTNLIISVTDGSHSGKGEAAPNVRYNETPEKLLTEFERFKHSVKMIPDDHHALLELLRDLSTSQALAFAIESAFIHRHLKKTGQSFSQAMKVPEPMLPIPISYTIPIMEPGAIKVFYEEQKLSRFPFIKLKINDESAYDCLNYLISFSEVPVMVDANEGFKEVESCIYFLEKIRKMPIVLVEQLLPASAIQESIYLKKYCPFTLFADETVTDQADFSYLKKAFDGINVKLMKAGSYANGIHLLKEARAHGMQTMIGCMVETTLGISSAMNLCGLTDYNDLDSFILLREEPFRLIKENKGNLWK